MERARRVVGSSAMKPTILALVVLLGTALANVGCGGPEPPPNTPANAPQAQPTPPTQSSPSSIRSHWE